MSDIRQAREAFYGSKKVVSRGGPVTVELREDGDSGALMFRGYACVTDRSYEVHDWLGEYDETIARGAFAKSLQEQHDTRLLVNHDGVPLARTKSGTLVLREIIDPLEDPQGRGQTGLWCEASLDSRNPKVIEIKSAMDRGDLSEMSFAFSAIRQEWNEDYSERTVLELRTYDVSVVTYPANPATSASLSDERSDTRGAQVLSLLDAGRGLDQDQRAFVREALEWREAFRLSGLDTAEAPAAEVAEVSDRAAALAAARLESAKVSSL